VLPFRCLKPVGCETVLASCQNSRVAARLGAAQAEYPLPLGNPSRVAEASNVAAGLLHCSAMRVAIQGELGSFSHEAAQRMLRRATVVPCVSSAEVFGKVRSSAVAAAVIPIENTLAGSVAEHLDLLLSSGLFIQREFRLRIQHNLIAAPGVGMRDLRQVFSHPVALQQCRRFFRENPKIQPTPFYGMAGAGQSTASAGLCNHGASR